MYDMRKLLNTMAKYNGWHMTDEQIQNILIDSRSASDDTTLYNLLHERTDNSGLRCDWISKQEQPPSDGIDLWVCSAIDGRVAVAWLEYGGGFVFYNEDDTIDDEDITHWAYFTKPAPISKGVINNDRH